LPTFGEFWIVFQKGGIIRQKLSKSAQIGVKVGKMGKKQEAFLRCKWQGIRGKKRSKATAIPEI